MLGTYYNTHTIAASIMHCMESMKKSKRKDKVSEHDFRGAKEGSLQVRSLRKNNETSTNRRKTTKRREQPSRLQRQHDKRRRYSEQKNCLTKGQISLVRQIAAQITKVNP